MKHYAILLSLPFVVAAGGASAAEKFTILLDWFVNPDHGPLFVAKERGYFKAAGLVVNRYTFESNKPFGGLSVTAE